MKLNIKLMLVLCFICQPVFGKDDIEVVKKFVEAFNDKNVDAMLIHAAPDMKWLSIAGHNISVETSSTEELKGAMTGYFKSMPTARSAIQHIHQSGPFVYALEKASWTSDGTEKSQCSMAMYELDKGKLKHVWYFQSHRCD